MSGSVHDLTAARVHVLGALYAAAEAGLPTLADSGYDGAGIGIHTPIKQPDGNQIRSPDNRTCSRFLRALRCLGERGFALLKGRRRIRRHITLSPGTIGDIARAALVRTHFERDCLPEEKTCNDMVRADVFLGRRTPRKPVCIRE
ncbi:transposase family protein [Nonomuraea sp. NPDC048882]|uniref:transposase family protein n=1 Tax=unclassified Nonomuraea TaxID=2593643 RepID=UPI0033CA8AC9